MAAKFTATHSATADREVTHPRAGKLAAYTVTCTCEGGNCQGTSVLVPAVTIDNYPKKLTRLALHNFVAQARVLGHPAA